MKKYVVKAKAFAIGPGCTVRLTAAQAGPRMHCLQSVAGQADDGRATYRVTAMIQFKSGEAIEYGGELNRSQAEQVADPEQVKEEVKKKSKSATEKASADQDKGKE